MNILEYLDRILEADIFLDTKVKKGKKLSGKGMDQISRRALSQSPYKTGSKFDKLSVRTLRKNPNIGRGIYSSLGHIFLPLKSGGVQNLPRDTKKKSKGFTLDWSKLKGEVISTGGGSNFPAIKYSGKMPLLYRGRQVTYKVPTGFQKLKRPIEIWIYGEIVLQRIIDKSQYLGIPATRIIPYFKFRRGREMDKHYEIEIEPIIQKLPDYKVPKLPSDQELSKLYDIREKLVSKYTKSKDKSVKNTINDRIIEINTLIEEIGVYGSMKEEDEKVISEFQKEYREKFLKSYRDIFRKLYFEVDKWIIDLVKRIKSGVREPEKVDLSVPKSADDTIRFGLGPKFKKFFKGSESLLEDLDRLVS